MKKVSLLVLLFFLMTLVLSSCSFLQDEQITLNVYNWENLIADGQEGTISTEMLIDTNEEFTKQTGIKINYNTFSSNEELYAKISSKAAIYDVIIPSDYMIAKLIHNDLLAKIDFSKVPNSRYIDDNFQNMDYDPTNEYSIPYVWGCTGVIFNKNFVDKDEVSWQSLWEPKLEGKILMFDNSRDAFSIPQFILEKNVNSLYKEDWLECANLLKEQKPLLQAYVMDQIFNKMDSGEAYIAPYYAADAYTLMQNNEDLDCVVPKEGTNLFVDAMCIPSNSPHMEEALQYINFMCDPNIGYANCARVGYSSPMSEVKYMFDESVYNNPLLYPDEETLSNAQTYSYLPEDMNLYIDKLWIDIKTGAENRPLELVIILLAFVVMYVLVVVHKRRKRKQ